MALRRTREERNARLNPKNVHVFNLRRLDDELWDEPAPEARGGRTGVTLVKTPELRVLMEVLDEGSGLPTHVAPGPITLQVLEGSIRFQVGDEVVYLDEGELLSLPSREHHSVEAVQNSVLLLTIAPSPDRQKRNGSDGSQ